MARYGMLTLAPIEHPRTRARRVRAKRLTLRPSVPHCHWVVGERAEGIKASRRAGGEGGRATRERASEGEREREREGERERDGTPIH
jgi:hypothetical protein